MDKKPTQTLPLFVVVIASETKQSRDKERIYGKRLACDKYESVVWIAPLRSQ